MTVQELIDILRKQDPTDVVCVETYARGSQYGDTFVVTDEWIHKQIMHDGESHEAFVLVAYGDPDRLAQQEPAS